MTVFRVKFLQLIAKVSAEAGLLSLRQRVHKRATKEPRPVQYILHPNAWDISKMLHHVMDGHPCLLCLLSQCFLSSQRSVVSPLPALKTDRGRRELQKELAEEPGARRQSVYGQRSEWAEAPLWGSKPLGPQSLEKQERQLTWTADVRGHLSPHPPLSPSKRK